MRNLFTASIHQNNPDFETAKLEYCEKVMIKGPGDVKVKYTQLFIDGKFVDSIDGKTFEASNPATKKKICDVQEANEKDVNVAVKAARKAFPKWRDFNNDARAKLLYKVADLIERDKDYIAALECIDNGKPYKQLKDVDLPLTIQQFRYYAGFISHIGDGKTLDHNDGGEYLCYTLHEPYGVCGQIIPWNFPLLMFAWKVAPALACGNCVVIKSSETTPLSALYTASLFKEAGLPDGVLNVLAGFGPTCGAFIAKHPDVDKVSFTGSTGVGKSIMVASGNSNLKCVSLELGGKSPLIVYPDMKDRLEWVVDTCCNGVYFNQGQVCCASSRVFVHADIYDDFLAKAKEFSEKRIVCEPFDPKCEQGAQNSKKQFDKIMKYIEIGKKEAKLVTGGEAILKDKGYFVQPTLFADVTQEHKICRDEIFGPVICVIKFKDTDEVIEMANDTTYGLAAGVLTNDITTALRVSKRLQAGTVWVNCYNVFDGNLPFGGYKMSGFGKDCGSSAVKNYMREKVVIIAVPGLKDGKP